MQVIRPPEIVPAGANGWCAALGMFDGVHLGHRSVLNAARRDAAAFGARTAAVTFDPHPLAVVNPARAPRLIQTLPQRLRCLAAGGADAAVVVPFDQDRAAQSAEDFVAWLAASLPLLRSVSVGEGFHFGRGRKGGVALLRDLGSALGFAVNALRPLAVGGETVSSSGIRRLLREGDLNGAAGLLGRPCSLAGRVVHGDRLARRLGFPTANLDVAGLELPPNGVYAGRASADGRPFPAAINIGVRPTVSGGAREVRVEAHLLGYDGDLYGCELEIALVRRLRGEQRFPDLESLRRQIGADVAAVPGALAEQA